MFQCSSASRKFLKAPVQLPRRRDTLRFSALQRAENSSNSAVGSRRSAPIRFQCSSASRKFLKRNELQRCWGTDRRFSALQRAENSSNAAEAPRIRHQRSFSALQRAENSSILYHSSDRWSTSSGFSALQRAENSSITVADDIEPPAKLVSVLFSEPKIPQLANPLPNATGD